MAANQQAKFADTENRPENQSRDRNSRLESFDQYLLAAFAEEVRRSTESDGNKHESDATPPEAITDLIDALLHPTTLDFSQEARHSAPGPSAHRGTEKTPSGFTESFLRLALPLFERLHPESHTENGALILAMNGAYLADRILDPSYELSESERLTAYKILRYASFSIPRDVGNKLNAAEQNSIEERLQSLEQKLNERLQTIEQSVERKSEENNGYFQDLKRTYAELVSQRDELEAEASRAKEEVEKYANLARTSMVRDIQTYLQAHTVREVAQKAKVNKDTVTKVKLRPEKVSTEKLIEIHESLFRT